MSLLDPFGGFGDMLGNMSDAQREKLAPMLGLRCECGASTGLKVWPPTKEMVCGSCHMKKAIDFARGEKGPTR